MLIKTCNWSPGVAQAPGCALTNRRYIARRLRIRPSACDAEEGLRIRTGGWRCGPP